MKEILEYLKEVYSKKEFYNIIAEEGIIIAVLLYLMLTIGILVFTIIPIIPIILINEKSIEIFKEYKCTGKYKEDKKICKKCEYKEDCKNGF